MVTTGTDVLAVGVSSVTAVGLLLWLVVSEGRRLRADDDLASSLALPFVLTAAVLVPCTVGYVVLELVLDVKTTGFGFMLLIATAVPWTAFALTYAGWGGLVTRRRVAVGSLATGLALTGVVAEVTRPLGAGPTPLLDISLNVVLFAVFAVVFAAAALVVLSSYRHGGVSTAAGVVVVLPVVENTLFGAVSGPLDAVPGSVVSGVTVVVVAATLVLAVDSYDVLSVRPGAGVVGERTAMREIDEAVLVVDERGRVARTNQTAERLFGTGIEGRHVEDCLGCSVEQLRADSVELWTEQGKRRFSPRIAALSGGGDDPLGHAVTLFDITDRELRRRRIQVLNRILRHNIRNEIDVIKAHAQTIDREGTDSSAASAATIEETADRLSKLSTDARRFETLVQRASADPSPVPVEDLVADAVAEVEDLERRATLEVDLADVDVTVSRDLAVYALAGLLENAVEHGDAATPEIHVVATATDREVDLVVADDGPGIPETERSVLETGEEDQYSHSTRFGLWSANWAIQAVGGDVAVGTSDLGGAEVRVTLPRRTRTRVPPT